MFFKRRRAAAGGGTDSDANVNAPPTSCPPPAKKQAKQASLASFGFSMPRPSPSPSGGGGGGGGGAGDAARAPPPDDAARAAGPANSAPPQPPPTIGPDGLPLARDAAAHARWQHKLAADESRRSTRGGCDGPGPSSNNSAHPPQQQPLSPLEKQVLALQAAHPGTVLAIEVGYKFVFYGRDAEIASAVLRSFAYVSRNFLTTAVPVPALARAVRRLVAAGHRVGVVRQVETAALKKAGATADGKGGPFKREVTAVYTAATVECGGEEDIGAAAGLLDGRDDGGGRGASPSPIREGTPVPSAAPSTSAPPAPHRASSPGLAPPASTYFFAVAGDGDPNTPALGVAAVDAAAGDALWGAFDGPAGLEGALLRLEPCELVGVRPLPAPADRALSLYAGDRPAVRLEDEDGGGGRGGEGGVASASHDELAAFFRDSPGGPAGAAHLPPAAARALAAALRRLRAAGLDGPLRALGAQGVRPLEPAGRLVLSASTLASLDVLTVSGASAAAAPARAAKPSSTAPAASPAAQSLLWLLDRTRSRGGRRLLRDWVARPLGDVAAITARLDAVEELVGLYGVGPGGGGVPSPATPSTSLLSLLPATLGRLPDLERGLARALHRTAAPAEFVRTLQALAGAGAALGLRPRDGSVGGGDACGALATVRSPLLRRLLAAVADSAAATAASAALAPLDVRAAAAHPVDRVALLADADAFPATAAGKAQVAAAQAELDDLLPALRSAARDPSLCYVSVHNQGTHLLELPVSTRPPAEWVKVSGTKKMNRYLAPAVSRALAGLEQAKERLAAAAAAEWKTHLSSSIAPAYAALRDAAAALASLDALLSLADAAASEGWVRPTFLPVDDGLRTAADLTAATHRPAVRFKGLVHPMLAAGRSGGGGGTGGGGEDGGGRASAAVPNDLALGGDAAPRPRALILTGPNMGGKSSLARAVGLAVLMAHVGSYVAAAEAALTPCDAVFTRMGASDDLLKGRSTFYEEMADASAILARATPRSLAIVDELGRGTSTHDGAAVAAATLAHLAGAAAGEGSSSSAAAAAAAGPGALTIFITHYSDLARGAASDPGGAMVAGHMACLERPADGDASVPHITFLYRLVPGVAKSSFGLNVARLAGLPEGVIARAAGRAATFQAEVEAKQPATGGGQAAGSGLVAAARAAVAAVRAGAGVDEVKALAGGAVGR